MVPSLLESISNLIFRMQSLVTLSFRNSRFGYDTFTQKGFASLMKAISATFSLQSLDLSRTHFETLGMYTETFPSMLNINASLTHVDISGNSFDPQRVLKWLHFQLPSLKSFVMQECSNKIKYKEWCRELVNLNSLLMVTNLEILNFNDFKVYRMFGGLHGNRSLRKLTLKNFHHSEPVTTPRLQELYEKCHLGFCLAFVEPVKWFGILQSSLQMMNPLVEMITFNLYHGFDAQFWLPKLAENASSLNSKICMEILSSDLTHRDSVFFRHVCGSTIQTLILSNCTFSATNIDDMLHFLQNNPSITTLKFMDMRLSRHSCIAIATMLQYNLSLKVLYLQRTSFHEDAFKMLQLAISCNSTLQELYITSKANSDTTYDIPSQIILNPLLFNSTIHTIRVSGTLSSHEDSLILFSSASVRHIYFSNSRSGITLVRNNEFVTQIITSVQNNGNATVYTEGAFLSERYTNRIDWYDDVTLFGTDLICMHNIKLD